MTPLTLQYPTLGLKVIVKIFELADILEIPPKVAAELYLENAAKKKAAQTKAAS